MAKPRAGSPVDIALGARVRLLRLRHGWSQGDVGRKLDVTFQQVQKYEGGTNRIAPGRLIQLAEAFKVSIAELLGDAIAASVSRSAPVELALLARCTPARRFMAAAEALEKKGCAATLDDLARLAERLAGLPVGPRTISTPLRIPVLATDRVRS